MTAIDWIIVAFTILMAGWGYSQGLLVGALSLAGFLGGGFVGSRLGPLLLEDGSRSPYAPVFALVGAFLIGGLLASILETVGFQLRRRLPGRLGRGADGVGGAVLLAAAGLGLAWMAGAIALQDRKSTRLNSSHANISYAVFCLKKKRPQITITTAS